MWNLKKLKYKFIINKIIQNQPIIKNKKKT